MTNTDINREWMRQVQTEIQKTMLKTWTDAGRPIWPPIDEGYWSGDAATDLEFAFATIHSLRATIALLESSHPLHRALGSPPEPDR
jgi:hypothetical protein